MRIFMIIMLALFSALIHAAPFTLSSNDFSNNERIPILFTCNSNNMSPSLSWQNAPTNTKSFTLILNSPDFSAGNVYLWIVFNIPPDVTEFKKGASENLPHSASRGENFFQDNNYRGPCAPDADVHHYVFTIYALDTFLTLAEGAMTEDVIYQMKNHILGQATLTGAYSH